MRLRQIAERYGLTPDGVDFALSQYQIVISEITHGMMSKLSYYAKDIIQVAQERWCDTCDLKVVSGWISVKDRLPDTSIEYIVCAIDEDGEQFVTSDHWLDTVRHWYLFDEHADSVVTHWMPLPEPPKEGDSE